jgi:hypothetical protein
MNLSWSRLHYEIIRNDILDTKKYFLMLIIVPLILLLSFNTTIDSFALKMLSGDKISIDKPFEVDDDVFVSAGTVNIDAPVNSATVFANVVNVNAPIKGDLFITAGQISINSNVSGKIVAAGEKIEIKGKANNIILAGNTIKIHATSIINKDAYVAAGSITNEGKISGQLVALTNNIKNTGNVGKLDIRNQDIIPDIQGWLNILHILTVIGFGILGVILVRLMPIQFDMVYLAISKSIIKNTLVGFLLIIVFVLIIPLSAITIVGLSISAFGLLIFLIGLMLSTLFLSFAIGKKIIQLFKQSSNTSTLNNIISFLIGFIILNLLFILPIPFFGQIAQVIAVSLGFGSIYYAIRKKESLSTLSVSKD